MCVCVCVFIYMVKIYLLDITRKNLHLYQYVNFVKKLKFESFHCSVLFDNPYNDQTILWGWNSYILPVLEAWNQILRFSFFFFSVPHA